MSERRRLGIGRGFLAWMRRNDPYRWTYHLGNPPEGLRWWRYV